jgi:hypothetical protein
MKSFGLLQRLQEAGTIAVLSQRNPILNLPSYFEDNNTVILLKMLWLWK